MNLEKYFNPKRFVKYFKYNLFLNSKANFFLITGVLACIFLICCIFINQAHKTINLETYTVMFSFAFGASALIISSQIFKSLHQKKDLTQFLMLPASIFEKFIAEFVLKIALFVAFFIPVFWTIFKISVKFCNLFRWNKPQFQIGDYYSLEFFKWFNQPLDKYALMFSIFSVICFLFAGATYFRKYSFVKTIMAFGLLIGIFFINMILFSHLFFDNPRNSFFYIEFPDYKIKEGLYNIQLLLYVLGMSASLFLLPLAYFNLKEKTV